MNIKYLITPPIVNILRMRLFGATSTVSGDYIPKVTDLQMHEFTGGKLKGRKFLCDPRANTFQASMLDGTFDNRLFEIVDRTDWSGKTMYDIGSHVGFHALNFAQRVGDGGKVYCFEPHSGHRERITKNLEENPDLKAQVSLIPLALGDSNCITELVYSSDIESSASSMSYISEARPPCGSEQYSNFERKEVEVSTLDHLVFSDKLSPPGLIKIDVEGAEGMVISGAIRTIHTYRPLVPGSVHNLHNLSQILNCIEGSEIKVGIIEFDSERAFITLTH